MRSISLYAFSEPLRLWSDYAWKAVDMMTASSQVFACRSRQMLLGSGSQAGQLELMRMAQEKFSAAAESMQAMAVGYTLVAPQLGALALRQFMLGTQAFTSMATVTPAGLLARQARFAQAAMAGTAIASSRISGATARVAIRGLAPIRKRATANARGLRRRKAR